MTRVHAEPATLQASLAPTDGITLLRASAPALAERAEPGQFVMARLLPAWDPVLREPLLIAGIDVEAGAVTLWLPAGSPGREQLQQKRMGSRLDLLGPLGRPFVRRGGLMQVLLVAEGHAVGSLLALAGDFVEAGVETTLLAVIAPDSQPYPPEALPVALEYQRAPRGDAGAVAHDLIRWAGTVYAAGSRRFYQDLAAVVREARPGQRGGFVFGSLLNPFGWSPPTWGEPAFACGLGACRACQVSLRRERRLVCLDGPTFDLWAL